MSDHAPEPDGGDPPASLTPEEETERQLDVPVDGSGPLEPLPPLLDEEASS